jgi:hypothetical protein
MAVNWYGLSGWLCYTSGWDGLKNGNSYDGALQHEAFETEQDANIRARIHFGKDVWNYAKNPIFGSGENNPFDQ